jgi:hypothetical protein
MLLSSSGPGQRSFDRTCECSQKNRSHGFESRQERFFPHRFAAAFLAMALRLAGDSAFARAAPPLTPPSLPSATAAGFLTGFSGSGGAFPVAISTIILAS